MITTQSIAEAVGVLSSDVEITTSQEGQSVRILIELTELQQAKFDYYLATGKELDGWLHNYPLRVIVPKSILQANRDLLIFKSYAEIMGLPYEILPDEVHFYCNEILEEDKPTLDYFNLTVEER
jgi:hypothetical protein